MALSLTSYNISQFTIDISAFQSAQVAYVKLRHYSNPEYEAMLAFFYDSASEYYFNATLNDNPIPYDFSSEGLRLSTSSFEGSLVLTLYYISDVYLAFSSSDFKVEQTLVLPVSDNGSGDGSTSVDLTSVIEALSALDTKLSNKIDSLDVQIPDDLNSKLLGLSVAIENIDLSSVNPAALFLDGSLNGNGSRYRDGQIVKVTGFLDSFKVEASTLVRTDTQVYTVMYKLLRDIGGGVYSELHYVPELLVFTQAELDASKVGN